MSLSKKILKQSDGFPDLHKFGLTSQILRSAVSIPSNIAEGSGRGTEKEFNRFLGIALASSFELETQLILTGELNFFTSKELEEHLFNLNEIQKMIRGFQKTIMP